LNPAFTTNLLKTENSIENNALLSSSVDSAGVSNGLFSKELALAIKDVLAVDGKLKPQDLAALKDLGLEQLADLEDLGAIQLPAELLSDFIELQKNQLLAADSNVLNSNESAESLSLLGNPDTISLLKTDDSNKALSENDLLNIRSENAFKSNNNLLSDVMHQSTYKKDSDFTQSLNENDVEFFKSIKELLGKDSGITKELLLQTNKPEINTSKLVDQLSSLDKPVTFNNFVTNHSLKTYSSLESSGAMMNRIEVPVTQAGWGEAVGNRLMMMVSGKIQAANIHLNPAELGPIEIKVNVNQEQATVHFVSNNSVVRDAIEEAFPRLKEMFTQNGLSLSDANVSQQSSQQGQHSASQADESAALIDEKLSESINTNQTDNNDNKTTSIGLVDDYV